MYDTALLPRSDDPPVARIRIRTADLLETTVRPPESLRPWISELGRIPMVADLTTPFTRIPIATTTIVLWTQKSGWRDASVLGPQTRASYALADGPTSCVRLRLAPGATRPLLGVAAAELTDRMLPLAELPGVAGDLAYELAELAPEEIIPYLEDVLLDRISESATQRAHRELVRDAMSAMAATSSASVPGLAAELAVSERQLRNLFATGIGVSPKHFARIGRIRHLLAHATEPPTAPDDRSRSTPGDRWRSTSDDRSRGAPDNRSRAELEDRRWTGRMHRPDDRSPAVPPTSLAQLATDTGYYDQSHMSADFRALMGVPPGQFFRGQLPAPTPCPLR